jgi:Na+/proline symporter
VLSSSTILIILIAYFVVLIAVSWFTSRKAKNEDYYVGGKKSPWFIVAFGMIGASLSGITFISIPGWVGAATKQFGYMQMVFGYFVGYLIIAYVLMPLYYKLNLTSIYTYLRERFGKEAHKTGAVYFLISRITGASIRLLLVANVLQSFVFNDMGIPFEITVLISIGLIWLYTFRGGIKTIIWTDTMQTLFMLLSLAFTIMFLKNHINFEGSANLVQSISNSGYSKIFFFDDWSSSNHFVKMFFGGIFIAIGMTGLDQDMMQKNLSCKNIGAAQKNMMSFSALLIVINLVFLGLGALLYMYAQQNQIAIPMDEITGKERTDLLFPEIALRGGLPMSIGVLFLLGLVAAAYSSADSALTSLTTSVCVDFVGDKKEVSSKQRKWIHLLMSGVLLVVVIIFKRNLDDAAIWQLITLAGYTYGPLIALFFYGILTKRGLKPIGLIVVCILSPTITYFVNQICAQHGFQFGATLIILNAFITYFGLHTISKKITYDKRE